MFCLPIWVMLHLWNYLIRFRKQNCLTDIFVCKHQEKVIFVVSISESESMVIASLVFTLIGKMAITGSFSTIFLFTPELYPTNLRYICIYRTFGCLYMFLAWLIPVCFTKDSIKWFSEFAKQHYPSKVKPNLYNFISIIELIAFNHTVHVHTC